MEVILSVIFIFIVADNKSIVLFLWEGIIQSKNHASMITGSRGKNLSACMKQLVLWGNGL